MARRGAIICMIAFAVATLFYVSHRPVDTRTRDGITIYSEGVPTTWKLDYPMNKYAPSNIEDAMREHCKGVKIKRTERGDTLIPGDAIYYARERFLRDLTSAIGISLAILLILPFLIYWHIQLRRIEKDENEE